MTVFYFALRKSGIMLSFQNRLFRPMIHFTLYSRSYCHLCEDLLQQLHACMPSLTEVEYQVQVIDIDLPGNEKDLALYDELVPVLFASKNVSKPIEICHYHLNQDSLKEFLNA
jgi:hypothetical protein